MAAKPAAPSRGNGPDSGQIEQRRRLMDTQLKVDRKELIDGLGGEAAVRAMDHEARADAIEDHLSGKLDAAVTAKASTGYPTVAEIADAVDTRGFRRGV